MCMGCPSTGPQFMNRYYQNEYIFTTPLLPLLLYPEKQFRARDKVISWFTCNGQKPRVKFETLQIEKHGESLVGSL